MFEKNSCPEISAFFARRFHETTKRSGIRVNEIAERAHLTRPSVSHHLQILKEAGIVDMRKEGTKNYYYISADNTQWKQVKQLIDLIYDSVIHLQKEEEERHL